MSSRERALAEIQKRKELGVWSFVEPALAIGSSAIAEPIAGLAGLAALPFGLNNANRVISGVKDSLTIQPRTEQGRRGLASVAEFAAPVGEAFESASKGAGDFVFDKTGSAGLAAAAYSAPTIALEALGLKGARAIPGRQMNLGDIGSKFTGAGRKEKGAVAIDFKQAKDLGFDLDRPLTHSGGSITSIDKGGNFDGLFASSGDESFGGIGAGTDQTTFYAKNIADEGDISLDYDKTIRYLKSEYPDASEETIDSIYDITAMDKNVYDLDVNPLEDYGYDDLGEASWEAQRIRGQIAADQDFDAIAMDDEQGVSYLIPYNAKNIYSPDMEKRK
jgi:hypothetical protein